jgi:hypothetical protein
MSGSGPSNRVRLDAMRRAAVQKAMDKHLKEQRVRDASDDEKEGLAGEALDRKRARGDAPAVRRLRGQYAQSVLKKAQKLSKVADALKQMLRELDTKMRGTAGYDYGDYHPVGFGGVTIQSLDEIVALGARMAYHAERALPEDE